MSYRVAWEPSALAVAEKYAAGDREGIQQVFQAVDLLAGDPRPAGAFTVGASGLFPCVPQQWGYNERLRAALPLVKRTIREPAVDSDFWRCGVLGAAANDRVIGKRLPSG